jgi:DNA-binding GntR family transcriptional regulator
MFKITLRQSFTIAAKGSHRARALLEHRAVLDAIAARDAEGAREATMILLNQAAGDLVKIRGRDFAKRGSRAGPSASVSPEHSKTVTKR